VFLKNTYLNMYFHKIFDFRKKNKYNKTNKCDAFIFCFYIYLFKNIRNNYLFLYSRESLDSQKRQKSF
jgi:hypothetical protein